MMRRRGFFLTFEGGEGAGKTTLMGALEKTLSEEGFSVVRTREPGGTWLGDSIRELVLHQKGALSPYAELSLFLASRAQHIEEVLKPALEQGKLVLCDRFNDSSIAYQGAARGLGVEAVTQVCAFISQGLTPDLTFYLDIDPAIGLSRVSSARGCKDRIEEETLSFHQKIREAYHHIERKDPTRFHRLDGALSQEIVYNQALGILHPHLKATRV
jgi:dTMP kinase